MTCSRPQRTATGGLEPGTSRPKVLDFTTAPVHSTYFKRNNKASVLSPCWFVLIAKLVVRLASDRAGLNSASRISISEKMSNWVGQTGTVAVVSVMDKGSLVRDLVVAKFVVALSKSYLPLLSTG